eukprot:CAMPEP_0119010700 /NCGR_PEP_ID=MMETSP1176-20130426/5184_1 /TAXON_ID=265551 /ORGANISM="Synedropsis recta cf, Strain CCMP1620" /LENGTH=262 /DNA_ID=CAMNT_0006963409 /DNA_START=14 /DNA_END=799 /DNA_ORIENTATION=-
MTTTTARVLSIALLLITCAPLTSLCALLVSNGYFPGSFLHVSPPSTPLPRKVTNTENHQGTAGTQSSSSMTSSPPASSSSLHSSSLQQILQDPDATLEELWAALFRESQASGGGIMMTASLPTMQVHHWTIILPWGISLLLGVVVPCFLSLMNYLRPEEVNPDYPWISRLRKNERRLSRLVFALKDHRKVLQESDMDVDDVDNEGVPRWSLPLPGDPGFSGTRKVAGMCAVCLGVYACGDEVVWSSNPKCYHAFHEDCLLSW